MAEENKTNIPVPPRVAAINAAVAASPIPGISQAPSAFTPESLTGDTRLNQIPDQGVSTDGAGVGGQAVAIGEQTKADILKAETEEAATTAEEEKTGAFAKAAEFVKKKAGILASRPGVEKELGVGEKLQKFVDYTNEIDALDRAHQLELKAVQEQGLLTDVQKAARIREISRKNNFAKADLAILQTAANRNYLTAKQLADDKIQAQLEPLDLQIDFLDKYINFNKEEWSTDKRNAFNVRAAEVQDERNAQATELKRVSDTKLTILANISRSNLDPIAQKQLSQSVMNQTTEEGVLNIGSQFLTDPIEQEEARLRNRKLEKDLAKSNASQIGNEIDILQRAIDGDATPEEAARATALVYENQGIQVTKAMIDVWTNTARTITKTPPLPEEVLPLPLTLTPQQSGQSAATSVLNIISPLSGEAIVERGERRATERTQGAEARNAFFSTLFGG